MGRPYFGYHDGTNIDLLQLVTNNGRAIQVKNLCYVLEMEMLLKTVAGMAEHFHGSIGSQTQSFARSPSLVE